jgi:small subunit ribosomal protein S16
MQRLGRTHRPFYRISAIDIRTRRNGKVIENLGWYNPMAPEGEAQISLKEDRIREWLAKGAQPSETVLDMLGRHNLLSDKMKAQWEAEREMSRLRVACKQEVAKAEAAVKTLEEMVKAKTAEAASVDAAKAALESCKKSVSGGRVAKAQEFAAQAEAVVNEAKHADESSKAKAAAEAKAKADAEAAAKASEESAGG